jgi:DNA-binding transcriptional ArsR family regulator
MRSPQKTQLKFTAIDYSIYSAVWLHLYKRTIKKYPQFKWSTGQMRILCAIDALRDLYRRVNTSMGYTATQVQRLTSMTQERCIWTLAKLRDDGLLTEERECGPKRTIRRYKLTRVGQAIVEEMSGDMDLVHERIVDILYNRRLLKH